MYDPELLKSFMMDFWTFMKTHNGVKDWEQINNDAAALGKKYGADKNLIVRNFINAFLDAQDNREWEGRHGKQSR